MEPTAQLTASRESARRLPPWLKRPLPSGDFRQTKEIINLSGVATVCEAARCPNLSECWSKRHATFMILGEKCTRRCHFCAVATARPEPPAADEPQRVAEAVERLHLSHVVLTAVARDDLKDEGSGHFARYVEAIRERSPNTTVEVLPADFHARSECIETLCDAGPDVYNHNLEMVERLTPKIRPQGDYRRSLEVLRTARSKAPHLITKSGLMVGLGETVDELHRTLADLRGVDCDTLTIGQYLQPTLNSRARTHNIDQSPERERRVGKPRVGAWGSDKHGMFAHGDDSHTPVAKYYTPEEFDELRNYALSLGFLSVASGPFVRSSYNASSVFDESRRRLAAATGRTPQVRT